MMKIEKTIVSRTSIVATITAKKDWFADCIGIYPGVFRFSNLSFSDDTSRTYMLDVSLGSLEKFVVSEAVTFDWGLITDWEEFKQWAKTTLCQAKQLSDTSTDYDQKKTCNDNETHYTTSTPILAMDSQLYCDHFLLRLRAPITWINYIVACTENDGCNFTCDYTRKLGRSITCTRFISFTYEGVINFINWSDNACLSNESVQFIDMAKKVIDQAFAAGYVTPNMVRRAHNMPPRDDAPKKQVLPAFLVKQFNMLGGDHTKRKA